MPAIQESGQQSLEPVIALSINAYTLQKHEFQIIISIYRKHDENPKPKKN